MRDKRTPLKVNEVKGSGNEVLVAGGSGIGPAETEEGKVDMAMPLEAEEESRVESAEEYDEKWSENYLQETVSACCLHDPLRLRRR